FQCSPTAADGKIYAMNFAGEVFVVRAGGGEFKLLHVADLGEEGENTLRASVVPSHGRLFIRTSKQLFCVRQKCRSAPTAVGDYVLMRASLPRLLRALTA